MILEKLSSKILAKEKLIQDFFTEKFSKFPANFYNSVDLRHSGFKIAPIDNNCFPAGFNNLGESSKKLAVRYLKSFLQQNFPEVKKIALIPESHSRNLAYLDNIYVISELIHLAGYEIKIGTLIENITRATIFEGEKGNSVELHPINKENNTILLSQNYIPDLIILNNDLTNNVPKILQNISTTIIPSIKLGWYIRSKSRHFDIYNQLSMELSKIIEIDPWLISSIHQSCDQIDFKNQIGLDRLAKSVNQVLEEIKEKYQEHNIQSQPYCYVKADNGTYGMAVWQINNPDEILQINKKDRNKMNMLKNSVINSKVIVQEGIETIDKIDNKIAEPFIYLINGSVIANLYRANENRNNKNSLNASGAVFFDSSNIVDKQINHDHQNLSLIYQLLARTSALASSIEIA